MDKNYWADFYKKDLAPVNPTQFAMDLIDSLDKSKHMLEIGCGNGRDSLYFSKMGLKVTAIDQAENMINELRRQYKDSGIKFIADDFVKTDSFELEQYDYLYSRFSLHAITAAEEKLFLERVHKILKPNGMFFIEVRSVHDEIFGKGEEVEKNAFLYDGHFRRFIELDELVISLEKNRFRIIEKIQERDLAKYKNENPIVIRIKALKEE